MSGEDNPQRLVRGYMVVGVSSLYPQIIEDNNSTTVWAVTRDRRGNIVDVHYSSRDMDWAVTRDSRGNIVELSPSETRPHQPERTSNMDEVDEEYLRLIEDQAMTVSEIREALGTSQTAVRERLADLERRGLVRYSIGIGGSVVWSAVLLQTVPQSKQKEQAEEPEDNLKARVRSVLTNYEETSKE